MKSHKTQSAETGELFACLYSMHAVSVYKQKCQMLLAALSGFSHARQEDVACSLWKNL